MNIKNKAFFVDRDGVVNRMVRYEGGWDSPQKPEDVVLVDGIAEVVGQANKKNIPVVEISNQPGVAKGKMNGEQSRAIEERVHELLKSQGVRIDYKYICQHHPKGVVPELTMVCECRKPKPGLLLQAARELNIDLEKSFFLGDKAADVQAGKAAGCKTIIYLHDEDVPEKVEEARNAPADYKVNSLKEVVKLI
ncbi:hypothetical protein A2886_01780 [candidate division WWE3 bacterium RIFCSPHIGHO2_01_FULL_42_13]|uniref:D,D-heptose 1,7-bisphosphate phosphatase n=1 Tax=candidate division WWE3 bacterium RIFCSPHIGHO2_01_FULL_42_13 TaxID=1802617 RepID=A0A1F4URZ3_UNCKA|nr:MAG: hypothetical protein A2886_01780 [candidate division WWE3 bacterium RIFCSPHIGHO2_01_FULL_42_13]